MADENTLTVRIESDPANEQFQGGAEASPESLARSQAVVAAAYDLFNEQAGAVADGTKTMSEAADELVTRLRSQADELQAAFAEIGSPAANAVQSIGDQFAIELRRWADAMLNDIAGGRVSEQEAQTVYDLDAELRGRGMPSATVSPVVDEYGFAPTWFQEFQALMGEWTAAVANGSALSDADRERLEELAAKASGYQNFPGESIVEPRDVPQPVPATEPEGDPFAFPGQPVDTQATQPAGGTGAPGQPPEQPTRPPVAAMIPITLETDIQRTQRELNLLMQSLAAKVNRGVLSESEAQLTLSQQARASGRPVLEDYRERGVIGTDETVADMFATKLAAAIGRTPQINGVEKPGDADFENAARLLADIAEEIEKVSEQYAEGLLTQQEAEQLLSDLTRGTTDLSAAMREAGAIGEGQTSGDALKQRARAAVNDRGADGEALDLGRTSDDSEAMARIEKLKLAGIATQNIVGGGGVGQKVSGAVQLAGTGMLGSEAAALAGGPVGAAVTVAALAIDQVDGLMKAAGESARESIAKAAELSKSLASPDGQATFTKAVDMAADTLGKVPIVGTAAAEALKTFTFGLNAARDVLQTFANRGRELGEFNGDIAQAAAMADNANMLLEMQEANRNSEQYVKLIEAEAKVSAAWRRATDPLREKLFDFISTVIAPALMATANQVEGGIKEFIRWNNGIDALINQWAPWLNKAFDAIINRLKNIDEAEQKRLEKLVHESGMKGVEKWIEELMNIQIGVVQGGNQFDNRQLQIPVLKGAQ